MISSAIEQFILEVMGAGGQAELARNELAQRFNCAPSQINYVINTRFCLDRGYIVTSRRGGGGYVHIERVDADRYGYLLSLIRERIGGRISEKQACDIIASLYTLRFCSKQTAAAMAAAMAVTADDAGLADSWRAAALKSMLKALMREGA